MVRIRDALLREPGGEGDDAGRERLGGNGQGHAGGAMPCFQRLGKLLRRTRCRST